MRRGLIALLLAFGWLFATPAHATPLVTGDTVQFSYTWGSVTRTITDSVVTVTVVNDITNKIGGNGEVIDTYRITFADQVIEVTEKHGARDYTFTGSGTLTLEGIDRGFWGGYYGPIMTVSVSPLALPEAPTTQYPQTESPTQSDATESPTQSIIWDYSIDEGGVFSAEAPAGKVFSGVVARYVAHESDCGLDVSEIVGAVLIGSSSGTIPADNGSFGDPCPGWYKKLIVSVQYSTLMLSTSESPQVTQSATLSPEPEVQPTPQPSPEPSPEPTPEVVQPEPTQEPTPSPEPTASYPTQSPEPEPTESPIVVVTPEPATESPAPTMPPTLPTIQPEPQPSPIIEPSPVQSNEVISEEPSTTTAEIVEVAEETFSDSVSGTIETAVTEAIGAAVEVVGQLVEAFASAGLDMTPEKREEAQSVVVSTIIVSQVASAASAAAVSARKIK